jgi:hypothetical protein
MGPFMHVERSDIAEAEKQTPGDGPLGKRSNKAVM